MTRYTEWPKEKLEKILGESITDVGFSVRTANLLGHKGIVVIQDLLACKKKDLMGIQNFGEKSYREVIDTLRRIGFY
jgi:DNA-directed RNA polymerase alpha subunit